MTPYKPKPGAKYQKRNDLEKPEKIKRLCLRCERVFMAEGRFNRLCPVCQNLINIYYSGDIGEGRYSMHGRAA